MGKARVLAVDDQRYFRELIEGLLSDAGYDVDTAASGEEALQLLECHDYEIVLTDLVMPEMDGSELVRRIRERRPHQDVVVVTGVVDVKTAVDAMKQGATDYILKPFDRESIVDAVSRIVERLRLRSEHARLIEENLEYMGIVSLFERATALFSTLAVEPLAERLLEGLCLETRAQTGVLWLAPENGSDALALVGMRGMVRTESEPKSISLEEIEAAWCPGLAGARSEVAVLPEDADASEALFVPIRAGTDGIGVARLSDRLHGEGFPAADRTMAEKFAELGGIALGNAMRFRALERRTLRDADTRAYSRAYLDDAIRNEIHKANRFGHRFSLLRLDLEPRDAGRPAPAACSSAEAGELARQIEVALRGTDLLASEAWSTFFVLLPQTDALGVGVLLRRIERTTGEWLARHPELILRSASATFPSDATQLEALHRVLEDRREAARASLLVAHPELARDAALDTAFDRMLELGTVEPLETESEILRFVLEDVFRRPEDRGILFLSPGGRWSSELIEVLDEVRGRPTRTEVVVLAEGIEQDGTSGIHVVKKAALDARRPFAIYFGDGPAYAMVGQVGVVGAQAPLFQSADRALVEHLAFALQRELGILVSV
ncbi:MAG: response regulator [Myxococcota bacterium]